MNNLEVITAKNAERIQDIGSELAEAYKTAFAGDPWFEASRCANQVCAEGFSGLLPGSCCRSCNNLLEEAYNADELVADWSTMVAEENALFEVAFLDGVPQRATVARPTNPTELFQRKYTDVPQMESWLPGRLPEECVWIEDTFANRQRQATGNLKSRGTTLGRVARYFGGMEIVTRTLSPAIIAATLRDMLGSTVVYLGTERAGETIVNKMFANPGYKPPVVPDRRTLLNVRNAGK